MEDERILDIDSEIHIGALQRTFIPIIQQSFNNFIDAIYLKKKDGYAGNPKYLEEFILSDEAIPIENAPPIRNGRLAFHQQVRILFQMIFGKKLKVQLLGGLVRTVELKQMMR